ncbi:glycosyltransferase family 2 protein [Patescibacteria group bacterium]|nr:glycosyltransferase family 2 protein [Patescibacteria group bacterium]
MSQEKQVFISEFRNKKYYLRVGNASDLKSPRERVLFRLFEILPGFLAWLTFGAAILFSWLFPFLTAVFIIVFIIYWLVRTIYFSFYLQAGYKEMRKNEKVDWLEKLDNLPARPASQGEAGGQLNNWRDIYHLVLIPFYKEPLEILKETISSLERSDEPKNKIMVVLSYEERAGREAEKAAEEMKKKFEDKFFKFLVTCHPSNLPGEIPGHGSNDAWAAKKAKETFIDPLKIAYENIIVSFLDADTAVFPKYFSCLTYYYLTSKNPTRTSFQPIPLYINNIWQAPSFSRIFAFSSTFWHTMNQERPEKLITFSSHAMSFKALIDVGFKQKDVVSDDSRIFWQCFFKYDGDYRVQPIFYPISMDANCGKNFFRTALNVYRQQRRWAYGAGEIPYFLFGCLKNKKIPLLKKMSLGFELIESHWSWATASIVIFLLGWLPVVLGGSEFSQTLISYNLPLVTSRILTVAMLGLVLSWYFSILLLPPKPPNYGKYKYLFFTFSWLFLPALMIFFTSLPALDAQTRLMLGKYLGFWPTEKIRKISE